VTPTSIPMLAPAPGQAPGTGAGTRLSKDQPPARRLHPAASAIDRASEGWLITQTTAVRPATPADPGLENVTFPASAIRHDAYDAWLSHVWTAAACSRPVLLRGHVRYIDAATGEVTGTISTDDLPDQAIYKPCGNRRAASCPGCAETYRRDAFHLIRAGLAGGKGIPDSVTGHPVVFATFTAPSFGPVHTRPVRLHTCAGKQHCHCKPEPCHPRRDAGVCPHGRPLACYRRHTPADAHLGEPLCPDCYDYPAHVVWNAAAGELWRRTKQDIERHLIQLAVSRGYQRPGQSLPPIRLSHGKAAEYQARGAVHFHALLRLDGTSPRDPEAIVPPPPGITAADLEDAVRQAAANVSFTTKPHPDSPDGQGWHIAWGDQLDVRPVNGQGSAAVTGLAVASYLAKYATKGTEDTGHVSARITPDALDLYADPAGTHAERLIDACWNIGHAQGRMCGKAFYGSLRRWAHMLGFGGHFLTKARRYSVTFTALRQARVAYRRHHDTGPDYAPIECQEEVDTESTAIVVRLSYVGTGWRTFGDALLANTAADQARKRREAARLELADEYAEVADSKLAA
jgi:hypothetical protein